MIFSFPKGEKKELIEKKIKKTAVFSSERKTISQSHMHVGKEDERERKEEEERKELLPLFFVMSGGVRTRAQKRRMGERDVWDLIVNNDDICFKHILPRLNGTDLKFLYEVNSETRKLIKRSSRKGELKEKFKVNEMSSISTLEFAWENKSLWWLGWDETYFCYRVALTNKLELLKWAREEKKCNWDGWTINTAARQGNLEMVKYCVANECPICVLACANAALSGHLACLKYLREEAKAPWASLVLDFAHTNKHLECLRYAVEKKCPEWSSYTERLKKLEQSQ